MSDNLSYVHFWEPGADLAGPTLLLLHGTGGNEHDLVELGRSLMPSANLLSPRGQVNENGMLRFFRRLAEGVFDLEDLHTRTRDLKAFVTNAALAYGFDAAKVVAVGFSNGANIAASMLLSGGRTLAGGVLLSPMLPFDPQPLPDLSPIPVFVGAGEADTIIPPQRAQQLIEVLKASGSSVEAFWHPGGHTLTRQELTAAQLWLTKGTQPWN